jgi:virulence-associated protein VapD
VNFLGPSGVLVVRVDAQKPAANQSLRASLERRGFVIEQGAVYESGCAVSARRLQTHPMQKAA